MTIYEKIKTKNIDELATWLDKYGMFDNSPWINWWNETYCEKCEPEIGRYENSNIDIEFSYCELYHKCRYFPDMDETPSFEQIIKMWLESEG